MSSKQNHAHSVGIVAAKTAHISEPLKLACGRELKSYDLVYETYGELNTHKSNAILICHALSGHHHAAGYHSDQPDEKAGWWENCIGPGKPIDTTQFFVVVPSNIGGCYGSTGPNTRHPDTGKYWGADFPQLRVRDWVESQRQLSDYLDIHCWAAVIGGSLGGMQVMRWSIEHPTRLKHAVVLASAMSLTPQNIAFNELARKAIRSDEQFFDGHYLEKQATPAKGLALARMIAHITYLSDSDFEQRFGRELRIGSFERGQETELQFEVESYLNLAREYDNNPVKAFSHALCKFFVVSFSTDWRFSPERSREITQALIAAGKDVSYLEIETDKGHDAFLLPIERYINAFRSYMNGVASSLNSTGDR